MQTQDRLFGILSDARLPLETYRARALSNSLMSTFPVHEIKDKYLHLFV
uniref:Uncharacterized protein n=1 Tax=Arundo donax TaxID=35708 RepID=A0A0A8YUQ3_ARUDO